MLSGMEALREARRATLHITPNKLYRAELWQSVRFPKGKQNEDFFTLPLIFENVSKVVCIPEEFYNYVQRGNSIMNSRASLKRYDQAEAAAAYWKILKTHGQDDALLRTAEIIFVYTLETYCALSAEDQKAQRSTQMRKLEHKIMKDTVKVQKVPSGLLMKSFLLSAAPRLYIICRTMKTGR